MQLEEKRIILIEENLIRSEHLGRIVKFDCYLPASVSDSTQLSLLLINDGQDLLQMPFDQIMNDLYRKDEIEPLFCVGIHCSEDRKMEYGIASQPDYMGRGAKAGLYTAFILDELLPFIYRKYQIAAFKEKSVAGFSLGGLMALDIVWNHSDEFKKTGVFSGSLWWRQKSYDDGYTDDADRIMHNQVRNGWADQSLKFFFQAGLLDENNDRNNNGIIDSVDDVLDLIRELKKKGYRNESIHYLELADGKHDVPTWAKALPDFLKWGWGK